VRSLAALGISPAGSRSPSLRSGRSRPQNGSTWGARGRQFKSARPDHFRGRDPSLRSGFRQRAPASLTPAKRLKFKSARPDHLELARSFSNLRAYPSTTIELH